MRRALATLAVLLTACGGAVAATGDGETQMTTTEAPARKVFVCKYVGTPGVDERLQTGDNPISVDYHSLTGEPAIGQFFQDRQGRSVVIAFDTGQPEPGVGNCPPPQGGTTTTAQATTTTTASTTSTALSTTTIDRCPNDDCTPNTQGVTTTSTSTTTGPTTTGAPSSTTTSTTTLSSSTTSTSLTVTTPSNSTTTSTSSTSTSSTAAPSTTLPLVPSTSTTIPQTFAFGAATTVCRSEVPTIVINFQNTFPQLAGQTGTLTMADINGNVVSSQPLVYRPNTTVELLYPGTAVNADGSIDDVPGWILTDDGLWIRDPSDEFLREGIRLTYTVNPTATAFITYPPESSACANPDNTPTPAPPPTKGLPPTL